MSQTHPGWAKGQLGSVIQEDVLKAGVNRLTKSLGAPGRQERKCLYWFLSHTARLRPRRETTGILERTFRNRIQRSGSGTRLEFRIMYQVSRKPEEVNGATGWKFENRVKGSVLAVKFERMNGMSCAGG